jgi:hypothetical protein
MKNKFNIEITSVPDREHLVAEIWFDKNLIAELNTENSEIEVEIYPTEKLSFNLNEFMQVLEDAKQRLES